MAEDSPLSVANIRAVQKLIETEVERLQRSGAEAFARGDLALVLQLVDDARAHAASLQVLQGIERRIRESAEAAVVDGLSVKRKTRGVARGVEESVEASKPIEQPVRVAEADRAPAPVKEDANKRARLSRSVSTHTRACAAMLEASDWTEGDWSRAKAAACRGRALAIEVVSAEGSATEVLATVDALGRKMRELDPGSTCFAMNLARMLPVQAWESLSHAFDLFPVAYDAIEWLESEPDVDPERFADVLKGVGAVETLLFRALEAHVLGAWDEQQRELNSRVRAINDREQIYIPWWNQNPKHRQETGVILRAANDLKHTYESVRRSAERHSAKHKADDVLGGILETDSVVEDFEERLCVAVAAALDSGLAPSDKQLRARLAPFRFFLDGSRHPATKKLAGYLNQDANKAFASGKPLEAAEPDGGEDLIYQTSLGIVRPRLAGKTVLFIGGNKGQTWRIPQYKEELGLADLIWPDAEEKTNPGAFGNEIRKCDVAVMLVRWSRHSFKQALDEAKLAGKETMMLTRGLGIRTFVEAYREQVVGNVAEQSLN